MNNDNNMMILSIIWKLLDHVNSLKIKSRGSDSSEIVTLNC